MKPTVRKGPDAPSRSDRRVAGRDRRVACATHREDGRRFGFKSLWPDLVGFSRINGKSRNWERNLRHVWARIAGMGPMGRMRRWGPQGQATRDLQCRYVTRNGAGHQRVGLASRALSRTSALGNAATSVGRLHGCRSHATSMAQAGAGGVFPSNTKGGLGTIVCFSETRGKKKAEIWKAENRNSSRTPGGQIRDNRPRATGPRDRPWQRFRLRLATARGARLRPGFHLRAATTGQVCGTSRRGGGMPKSSRRGQMSQFPDRFFHQTFAGAAVAQSSQLLQSLVSSKCAIVWD
jgi:hypothetical protein